MTDAKYGWNLWASADLGIEERIEELLSRADANPNKQDEYGYTPLHFAATNGRLETVRTLLRFGADPNGGTCGALALHRAAARGHAVICEELVRAGSRLDAPDTSFGDQRTPLHKAADSGHVDIVAALLAAGANPRVVDKKGATPQALASKAGHPRLAARLARAEAEAPPPSAAAAQGGGGDGGSKAAGGADAGAAVGASGAPAHPRHTAADLTRMRALCNAEGQGKALPPPATASAKEVERRAEARLAAAQVASASAQCPLCAGLMFTGSRLPSHLLAAYASQYEAAAPDIVCSTCFKKLKRRGASAFAELVKAGT